MDDSKRQKYLSMLDKDNSTVGVELPESIIVNNKEQPVSKIVFNMSSEGKLPEDLDEDISDLKKDLIKEKNDLKNKIKNEAKITEDDAEEYLQKIRYVQRVINSLNPDEMSFGNKSEINEAKNERKWRNFVDKIRDP